MPKLSQNDTDILLEREGGREPPQVGTQQKTLYVVDALGFPFDIMNLLRDAYGGRVDQHLASPVIGTTIKKDSQDYLDKFETTLPPETEYLPAITLGTDDDKLVWAYTDVGSSRFTHLTDDFPNLSLEANVAFLNGLIQGRFAMGRLKADIPQPLGHICDTTGGSFDEILDTLAQHHRYKLSRYSVRP